MRILFTGATGLIGSSLCRTLSSEGHVVIALSRTPERAHGLSAAQIYRWSEPDKEPPPAEAIDGTDAVVHLAGESVAARRWTDEQKKRIRDSRVLSTRHLVAGLRSASRPAALINASAVGFYGDRGDEVLDEGAPAGRGFLSEVSRDWENEAAAASEFGIRVVRIRTGVVLSTEGGALKKMLAPFKLGLGGRLGNGRQWFPWIHIEDIVGIFRHSIMTESINGPVNGVAPQAATNAEFTRKLADALHRPAFFPVPEPALRALMGEMADMLFHSQRVEPKAALSAGYQFRFPTLDSALSDLFGSR